MRYVEARLDEFYRDERYRIYVTRSLQLAPQGGWLTTPYDDIVRPEPELTGEDIAIDVITKAGLVFKEE